MVSISAPLPRYLMIRFGGMEALLPGAAVDEILPTAELAPAPGLPAFVAGVLNLRGEAVPVVSLQRLFRLEADAQADPLYQHLLLTRGAGAGAVALLVDRALDVTAQDQLEALPGDEDSGLNGCIAGRRAWQGRALPVLDPERILLAEEAARLRALAETAQARLQDLNAAAG